MLNAIRPAVQALKAPNAGRNYAKATLIGRLGAKPEARQTASGKSYVTYNLAVPKPPKRDDKGEIVRDEKGFAVRETSWFTIFNFRPGASEYLPALEPGTQLAVEATLESRTTETEHGNVKDLLLRELSHQIVSRKKSD